MSLTRLTVSAAMLVALAGCQKSTPPSPGTSSSSTTEETASAEPQVDAHLLFQTRCVPCHGADGKGDGPGAAALNPKPRNYTDVAWQNSVTDEQIKKTILYGGAAVGKSPNMPANPDLDGKPELDGLVKVVREFKGK